MCTFEDGGAQFLLIFKIEFSSSSQKSRIHSHVKVRWLQVHGVPAWTWKAILSKQESNSTIFKAHVLSAHIRLPWPTKVSSLRLKLESKLCVLLDLTFHLNWHRGDACILIIMTWSNWHVESWFQERSNEICCVNFFCVFSWHPGSSLPASISVLFRTRHLFGRELCGWGKWHHLHIRRRLHTSGCSSGQFRVVPSHRPILQNCHRQFTHPCIGDWERLLELHTENFGGESPNPMK